MSTNAVANLDGHRTGRPLGTRNRLTSKLVSDLSAIWEQHGPQVLQKMALRDPVALARMAYATLPRDVLLTVEQKIPGGLSAEDWTLLRQVLDLIQSVLPAGTNALPAEVLGVIEMALRAHYAKVLNADWQQAECNQRQ